MSWRILYGFVSIVTPLECQWLTNYFQAKQIQIDDLMAKLDNSAGDLERLRDEKDQEILILQEGMDSTIQQISDLQQVGVVWVWARTST